MFFIKKYPYYLLFLLAFPLAVQAMDSAIFDDKEFINSSFRSNALQPRTIDFERLEFLGDRVLGLITAHMLYKNSFLNDRDAGELAKLYEVIVSKSILARMYRSLNIDSAELSSSSYYAPVNSPIAEKTASDITEALMGALYKAKGFEKIQEPLEHFIRRYLDFGKKRSNEMTQSTPITAIVSHYSCSSTYPRNFEALQEALGYRFKDLQLLHEAFQHSSIGGASFKKLDFLGVRILALIIADHVFTDYQSSGEGILTQTFERLVNNSNLEGIFQNWQLGNYLKKQDGGSGISNRMAANTVRTLISAIYLDGGWKSAYSVTKKLLFSNPRAHFLEIDPEFTNGSFSLKGESFEEPENEAINEFEAEEYPKLTEESINPKGQQELLPLLANKEPTALSKTSIWQKVNDSPVKIPEVYSKSLQFSPQTPIDAKAQKTKNPPQEVWPSLVHTAQPAGRKDFIWKNINESVIKSPEAQPKNVQSFHQPPIDAKTQKIQNPPQEMWPSLSNIAQKKLRK